MNKNRQYAQKGETILELCIALMLVAILASMTLTLTEMTSLNVKLAFAVEDRMTDATIAQKIVDNFVESYDEEGVIFTVSSDKHTVTANKSGTEFELIFDETEQTLKGIDVVSFESVDFWPENDHLLRIVLTYRDKDGETGTFKLYKAVRCATVVYGGGT